jgi:uncharacterized protein YjdB
VGAGLWFVGGRRVVTSPSVSETGIAASDSAVAPSSEAAVSDSVPEKEPSPLVVADSSKPASVTITERPSRPIFADSSATLAAEVRDLAGRVVPGATVGWSSTDSTVVLVDSASGTLRAVGPGRAQVIAAVGASRDSTRIVVRQPSVQTPAQSVRAGTPVASLSIRPHDDLRVGDTAMLVAVALDQRGNPLRAAQISWSSSEPRVAGVDGRTGKVRAYSPGTAVIIARSGIESAISPLAVLPAAVAVVRVEGARPLKVGDTLTMRAEPRDHRGGSLAERPVAWASSDTGVATVDSVSGVVVAQGAGSVDITAISDGKSGLARVTVLPQPRTGRSEPAAPSEAQQAAGPSREDLAAERHQVLSQMRAGVEQCYGALQTRDVTRLEQMYNSASKSDREKLRKLSRILRTDEWAAAVGEREDGAQRIDSDSAAMDFSFRLTWKDAFGGRLSSRPIFRAEFARNGNSWDMASCRIIGSPKL